MSSSRTLQRPGWRATRRESVGLARQLRREQTQAEAVLWERLRDRRLAGLKFRRQHVHRIYVLDFFCAECQLGIELDGPVDDQQADYDKERAASLAEARIRLIRFRNEEVERDVQSVLKQILEACKA